MTYIRLLLGFLKVGCFSFGGAYGAIPLIRDVVISNGWMDEARVAYLVAVSESTPGPIMINMATYVGSEQGGLFGALLATTGVVLPSFILILLIAMALRSLLKNRIVQAVLAGVKPCVVGIVIATGIVMMIENGFVSGMGSALDLRALLLTAALAALCVWHFASRKKPFPAIRLILLSAVAGCLLYGI